MNKPSPTWRDALAALIEPTRGEPAEHPDAERWLAYHRGELSHDDEEVLREHLVGCHECFDLVQAVAAFDADPDAEAEDGGEADAPAAASWRRLRGRLAEQGALDVIQRPQLPVSVPAPGAPRWLVPLAASLLVALIGLGGWSLYLTRELAELRRPRVNPVLLTLGADERAGGGEVTVASAPGPWTLIINPPLQRADESYRLELFELSDSGETRRHSAEDLTLDEGSSTLNWHLPEGLRPGRYRIDLSIRGEEGWQPLQRHPLRVGEPMGESDP